MTTARVRQTAETRKSILRVTRDLYLAEGIAGITMRRVANAVGVAPAALYWHFPDKEELVAAIFIEGVTAFMRTLANAREDTAAGRIGRTAEAFLRFGLDQPREFEVFFLHRPPAEIGAASWTRFEEARTASFRTLLEDVRASRRAGAADSYGAAMTLLSTCLGLMTLRLGGQLPGPRSGFEALFRARVRFAMTAVGIEEEEERV